MSEFFLHKSESQNTNWGNFKKAWLEMKEGWVKVVMTHTSKRTSPMNRYFHGPLLDGVFHGLRDAGFREVKTKEDAKVIVKGLFCKQVREIVNEETGEILFIEYIQDTHTMSKPEMSELFDRIIPWASEYLGVQIAYPNEQLMLPYEPSYIAEKDQEVNAVIIYK